MSKKDILEYFNSCAADWDHEMIRNDEVISRILELSDIKEGSRVLDVACGTGVLFGDYIHRGVAHVSGVDIAPEMVKIAQAKVAADPLWRERIRVYGGDIETIRLNGKFDVCMVYNAFPHFFNPERLIRVLAGNLNEGGRLTIAHGMSRAAIDAHHHGSAAHVSCGLISEDELAHMMSPYFEVDIRISDDRMYMVSGLLKPDWPRSAVPAGSRSLQNIHSHTGEDYHHDKDHLHGKAGTENRSMGQQTPQSETGLHQEHGSSALEVQGHVHSHEHTKNVLNRLSRAEGHLRSVKRMVEGGRDCSEVLIQLSAVISALNNTGKIILEDHIEHCIVDAVRSGDQNAVQDLKDAIDKFL